MRALEAKETVEDLLEDYLATSRSYFVVKSEVSIVTDSFGSFESSYYEIFVYNWLRWFMQNVFIERVLLFMMYKHTETVDMTIFQLGQRNDFYGFRQWFIIV